MNQLYIYIYPLFFRFFSHTGHYRVLSRVPCTETGSFEGELRGDADGILITKLGHGCELMAASVSINHSRTLSQVPFSSFLPLHSVTFKPVVTQYRGARERL